MEKTMEKAGKKTGEKTGSNGPVRIIYSGIWLVLTISLVFLLAVASPHAELLSEHDIKYGKKAMQAVDQQQSKTIRRAIQKINDPLLSKIMQWFLYTEAPNGSSFDEINDFIRANPDWPRMDKLRKNAEEVMKADMPPGEVIAWFGPNEPRSTQGWVRYGAALLDDGRNDEAIEVLRRIWVMGKFTKLQEKQFYKLYRKYLTKLDHKERLDRLLWEGSYWPSRRMFWKVGEQIRVLAEARFQLRHMRGNVDKAIAAIPVHLKNHPGLIYERLRWRRRKGKDTSARELLVDLPDNLPHIELWFKEREKLARRALNDGLITQAYTIISQHGLTPSSAAAYAEAEWMAGWIALRFLGEPEWGLRHFTNMVENVRYPISLARGGYWAGRAASDLGQTELAEKWYRSAALHTTTYYGQLAGLQVNNGYSVMLPFSIPLEDSETVSRFNSHELTRVAKMINEVGGRGWLRSIIVHLQGQEGTVLWKKLSADLASSLNRPDLSISVAKYAAQNALGLMMEGYPLLDLPAVPKRANGAKLERALVLALIRQESSYYVSARSRAGARGLMQLMPATAKRIAKRIGIKYSKSRLSSDGDYNLKIGQSYLSQIMNEFDGSYILALVAYNAGPGRARRWVKQNGHPRDADVDAVDWVELIPFDETRNYVQRILEGVQVYRAMLADGEVSLQLDKDLVR